ncbi:MAG TPA: peptidylprolyl isomerase [Puia sp.]|nr:peptidylprolyl isomerase [Puia sp.]
MRKFMYSLAVLVLADSGSSTAQTLFTYGDHAVSKQEFLRAFNKNNTQKSITEKSYRDYLELYVRFKLKVQAAYDMHLDTLAAQRTELQNFRNQVADSYINDNETMKKLVDEAFERSQHDIHLAHILIRLAKNASPADTVIAYKKAMAAYGELKAGKPFGEVAAAYSDDTTARRNHGDAGYITVFTLPYDLENLAYGTGPGKFSKIYRGNSGYHIFKNLDERKDPGKVRVAQILFAFPPGISESGRAAIKARADSVEELLRAGGSFGELAKKFSADNISYQNNGELAAFGVGKYDRSFEDAAFSLKKDGDLSSPVETVYGYHILKRLGRLYEPAVATKPEMDAMKQLVLADSRADLAKKFLVQKILAETGFKKNTVADSDFGILTDSALRNHPLPSLDGVDNKTVLFTFPGKSVTMSDWYTYIRMARNVPSLSSGKTYQEIEDQYIQTVAMEYYRNHLEKYNPAFAAQLDEFREGNMLFEIMQREIWKKASDDSAGLHKYFDANKNKYWWDASADAIVFTCNSEGSASRVREKIQDSTARWKKMLDASDGSMQADSGRFLLTQLPMAEQKGFQQGSFTSFVTNQPDNTVTFAYIVKVYNERTPRNFMEARGLVTNDYQTYLEDQWITALKKKYPVSIQEPVLKSLPKK